MLTRTDWVLLFLGADGGPHPCDQVRIMKGMFLLSQTAALPLEGSYRFESHEAGPFDPQVDRDLDTLQLARLVSVQRFPGKVRRLYELTDQGWQRFAELKGSVPRQQLETVESVKRQVTSQSIDELLEQIATEFPDYVEPVVVRMVQ